MNPINYQYCNPFKLALKNVSGLVIKIFWHPFNVTNPHMSCIEYNIEVFFKIEALQHLTLAEGMKIMK